MAEKKKYAEMLGSFTEPWLYLVSFLRYSMLKNVVTLNRGQRSLKVIENCTIR